MHGAGRCFCAGADISQFGGESQERVDLGRRPTDMLGFEELEMPVVAAIHGYALGGGLEAALACHYRVIDEDSAVGLPEVNIGLLPGGQGTQRLPRLIGCNAALELMTTGEHVPAPQALEWKVVDEIVPSGTDMVDHAKALCKTKMGLPTPKIVEMPPPAPDTDFDEWQVNMAKARPGEIAPGAIIRCVQGAVAGPTFRDGDKVEKSEFGVLVSSPESDALRHMFFAERAGAKVDGLSVKPVPIQKVGIVGAGLMGGGIGMSCAEAGLDVTLIDVSEEGLAKGLAAVEANFNRSRRLTDEQKVEYFGRMPGSTDYADLADCDLVVEAVFENMEVKKEIFAQLDKVCKPGAFMCSNTSALNIDEIASATTRPEFVMGTHFFSPANVMKLLENVRGAKTSELTIASMMEWGRNIGKWCILVGNCPGFVGNRMVGFYGGQARVMLEEGLLPQEVDGAAANFGYKVGPLTMSDIVGLDLGMPRDDDLNPVPRNPDKVIQDALVAAGRLGQKNGKGFFDYDESRTPSPSAEVAEIIATVAANNGTSAAEVSEELAVQRLVLPMVNEAFNILEEGMAQRPDDIDVCYVHGYSFPRHRGGPMFYADALGLPNVVEVLESIGVEPAPLLKEAAASGQSLAKFWAARQKAEVSANAAAGRSFTPTKL